MKKKILITGINGQDGAYLADFLLKKNFEVHGIIRRTSTYKLARLEYLKIKDKIHFHHSELNEDKNIEYIIKKIRPHAIYNLAAQSFVEYSFSNPVGTFNINYLSVLNILEFLRREKLDIKFYQASTSEMFGNTGVDMQNENTKFNPASPYAVSKLTAHYLVKNYRESFNKFFVSGILFNHESFLRGGEFVTKKIIYGLTKIKFGSKEVLKLGNLDSKRDWGHAKDYIQAMYLMTNSKKPDDYVVATGEANSIRKFIEVACSYLGLHPIFEGNGLDEICYDKKSGNIIIKIDKKYFRVNELDRLRGDPSKIKKFLKWKIKFRFNDLVENMVKEEVNNFHDNKKFSFFSR